MTAAGRRSICWRQTPEGCTTSFRRRISSNPKTRIQILHAGTDARPAVMLHDMAPSGIAHSSSEITILQEPTDRGTKMSRVAIRHDTPTALRHDLCSPDFGRNHHRYSTSHSL